MIVTGSSRGLGLAIVNQLLARGDTFVLGMARRPVDVSTASTHHAHWCVDLAEPLDVAERLRAWLTAPGDGGRPGHGAFATATLINNAASLATPGPLEDGELPSLSRAMRLGLEAPTLLTAAFLDATRDWSATRRRVLHISSGLGRRAMAGGAAYCAVKAGLDHLARAQSLDQAQRQAQGLPAASVVSLAPGVIDTDMQITLRGADAARFPERARFADLASQGLLATPQAAATKILRFIDRADFGAEAIADVRDA